MLTREASKNMIVRIFFYNNDIRATIRVILTQINKHEKSEGKKSDWKILGKILLEKVRPTTKFHGNR